MSEHTPLTEGDHVALRVKVARANDEQALIEFTSMEGPFSVRVPLSELARTSTATTDTGLRERVEALLTVGDIPWAIAAELRAALDATAAPTTDTGARDE
jgi:hypothetical protein